MPNDKARSAKSYTYKALGSYKQIDPKRLEEHITRMQKEVIPELKDQAATKEAGAQRLRLKGSL